VSASFGPGARAPHQAPAGLDHTASPPRAELLVGPRYSPNLCAWLRKQLRRHGDHWPYPRVFRDKEGGRWIGWIDEDQWFIGSILWRTICDGAKAEVGCWTFPIADLTEEPDFWARYAEIGRCLIDPEHRRGFLNEEKTRWLTDGDTRSCLWCGDHTQTLRRWTETAECERWEAA
jgi:hypothetical protein